MKQCPNCRRSYDDSQSFCLMDGTPLVDEPEQQTVVRQPVVRKRKYLLWIVLLVLPLLAIGATALLFLVYKFSDSGNVAKRKTNVNIMLPTPAANTTTKPLPTIAANVGVSPTVETVTNTRSSNQNSAQTPTAEAEEIIPIAWDTTVTGFNIKEGVIYKFQCPPQGEPRIVWGSDVYTQDSSICTAAVHAGIITLAEGGTVTVEFRPGRALYGSTERNGVKTRNFGEYPKSFVVR